MTSLATAMRINAKAVADLDEPQMKSLLRVLEKARADTVQAIADWLKTHDKDDAYTIQSHRALLHQLSETIDLIRHDLGPAVKKDLSKESTEAEKVASKNLVQMIKAGEKKYEDMIHPLRIDLAQLIMRKDKVLMHKFESSAHRYAGRTGMAIQHALAVGIVKGESVGQLVRRLMGIPKEKQEHMSTKEQAEKVGETRFFKARWDAERLVRTELVAAYNGIQVDALVEDNRKAREPDSPFGGRWMKRWDAMNDRRTCGICHDLDGVIVPAESSFPGGIDAPPIHACDRCAISPWLEGWVL